MSPPLAGAWIEILPFVLVLYNVQRRPPSRGRGLKLFVRLQCASHALSPPLAGAWIEIMKAASRFLGRCVAPPRGGVD